MTSTISQIEDELLEQLGTLDLFRIIDSIGRRDTPPPLNFPAAYVYFLFDRQMQSSPRPVYERRFDLVIAAKNLKSEKEAAQDAYALVEAARDALIGKDLGLTGVGPFECLSINIAL
ncbi:MAG TPA: hypothetical protein PKO06_18820, partial [Candidatus Ozemobacteraceae bacterium]|nr:hypothetical protein [Candidatus Ozemobacteraceae bacterium]